MSDVVSRLRSGANRTRRRRIILLVLLTLILAAVGYAAYYATVHKSLPIPRLADDRPLVMEPPAFVFSITGAGSNALQRPTGVAVGRDGRIYVTDYGRRAIRVFSANGRHLFTFSEIADGKELKLRSPVHLAISPAGELYVSDRRLKAIYIFDANGKYLRKYQPKGKPLDWTPLALAFDREGRLYTTDVGDTKNHRVRVFEADGTPLSTFGRSAQVKSAGQDPGAFYFPNGLAVTAEGLILVADGDNRRLQVFDRSGAFKQVIPTEGVPRGMALAANNSAEATRAMLYVVDALAHQVDIYSVEGEHRVAFGTNGHGPGEFSFPNDVAIGPDGRIYITDRENHQVQVWAFPAAAVPSIPADIARQYWPVCLTPLLFLPLFLLGRRRRYVVTADFVDAVEEAGGLSGTPKKVRWIVPLAEEAAYLDRVIDGIDLRDIVVGEEHSVTDAREIQRRLEVPENKAVLLALGQRVKRLCTEDQELRQLALLSGIEVLDHRQYLDRARRRKK